MMTSLRSAALPAMSLTLLLSCASILTAQQQKWTDANANTFYPSAPAACQAQLEALSKRQPEGKAERQPPQVSSPTITLSSITYAAATSFTRAMASCNFLRTYVISGVVSPVPLQIILYDGCCGPPQGILPGCSLPATKQEPAPPAAQYSYRYRVAAKPGDIIDGRLIGTIWSYALSETGTTAFIATVDSNTPDLNHKGLFVGGKLIAEDKKVFGLVGNIGSNLIGLNQQGIAFFSFTHVPQGRRESILSILGSDGSTLYASDRPIDGCSPKISAGTDASAFVFSPVRSDIVFVQTNTCPNVYYFTATRRADVVAINGTVYGKTEGKVAVRARSDVRYQDRVYYRVFPNASLPEGYIVSEGQILQPIPKTFNAWYVSPKGHIFFEVGDGITRDGLLVLPNYQTISGFEILRVARPAETDAGLFFYGAFRSPAWPSNTSTGFFTAKGPVITEGQRFSDGHESYTVHLGASSDPPLFFVNNRGQLLTKFGDGLVLASPTAASTPSEPCIHCAQIAAQYESTVDKREAIQLCHALIGALKELGDYRSTFLKEGHFQDIFPTVYYHITLLEMQRMANGKFFQPIETMQQLLAFFDAYKWNRATYESGQTAESQWQNYFNAARRAEDQMNGFLPDIRPGELGAQAALVLTVGIVAHVDYDLSRALRYSFQHRFHSALSEADQLPDFLETNDLL